MLTNITKRSVLTGLLLCVVVAGCVYYSYMSSARFDESLDRYIELARQSDIAAYVPGIEQNSIRQKLNIILVEVLSAPTDQRQRLQRAREGLVLLEDSERQINTIGTLGDSLAVEIARMDLAANNATDLSKKGTMRELVAHAKRRAEITQDIRGLSYRANYETAKIFNRIVEDNGALTEAHITDLNGSLPAVEEQFNRRANLYAELEAVAKKIESLFELL